MARVCFTPKCKTASNGSPAPYIALPEADTPAGQRVRDGKGNVVPHLIPPEFVEGRASTHFLYTYNGRKVVRDVKLGKVYRVGDDEAKHLRGQFPGLLEFLPDEELHEDTVGALLDQKAAAEDDAKSAKGELQKVRDQFDKLTIEVTSLKAENKNLKEEIDRLEMQLAKAKVAPKSNDDKKPAAESKVSNKK